MKKNALLLVLFFVSQVGFSQGNKTVYFEQGFEDNAFFSALSPNGYTVNNDSANGYWGAIKADVNGDFAVSISDEVAHSGVNSIKVTRLATAQMVASCIFKKALPVNGLSTFEVWVYRPTGSEFSCIVSGLNASSAKVDLAYANTAETGKFFIRNNTMVNNRTNIPMPADAWVLLRYELNWVNNKIVFSYEKDGVRTEIGELELIANGATKVDRFQFGAGVTAAGAANYFDDVVLSYSNDFTSISPVHQVSNINISTRIENDVLTISSIDPIRYIYVYNMNGMLVLNKNDTQSIHVDCLPKGLYLVEVQDVKGETVRKKVVK